MEMLYATIAKSSQAFLCDNRLCDIRGVPVQEGMDRERVVTFMEEKGLNNRQLADLLGISEDKVSKSLRVDAKARRWQGDEVLRLLTLMAGGDAVVKSEVRGTGMNPAEVRDAWMLPGKSQPVPLLGTAFGGDWEGLEDVETTELRLADVLDYIARPPSLADDLEAYAVEIVGDSMAPRYEPGEHAFVSPKAAVRPGDDVIVQLANPPRAGSDLSGTVTEVLIKRLVKRGANFIELRQFNPEQTFRVPIERVARDPRGKYAIHRVRGRL
jgi:hypothetical protein